MSKRLAMRRDHAKIASLLSAALLALIAEKATAQQADAASGLRDAKSGGAPVISVRTFGAACNGIADDTSAIRAAAAAVPASGAILRFPKGTCVIDGTIYVKSHTHIQGEGSTLLAGLPWTPDYAFGFALLENVHHSPDDVRDTDIIVNGMIFDYGKFGPVAVPNGGKHAVRFDFADDVSVTNNVFYVRGAEDAVAGLGVVNMLVRGNSAYEFRNCAYDFWYGPSNVRVVGNLAQTTTSAQMINFNPERTSGDSSGLVAKGLFMSGNTLIVSGPNAVPVQIEPLGPRTSVRSVVVTGNTLRNVYFVFRGDVQGATVKGNSIADVAGGAPAFESYPLYGGTPNSIKFTGNEIVEPQTQAVQMGVVRMEAKNYVVTDNSITGAKYLSAAIYHGSFAGIEHSNTVHR
jgi:hypothetical protein